MKDGFLKLALKLFFGLSGFYSNVQTCPGMAKASQEGSSEMLPFWIPLESRKNDNLCTNYLLICKFGFYFIFFFIKHRHFHLENLIKKITWEGNKVIITYRIVSA